MFDLLTPNVDHFMPFPCRPHVPFSIKIDSFVFTTLFTSFVTDERTERRTNRRRSLTGELSLSCARPAADG